MHRNNISIYNDADWARCSAVMVFDAVKDCCSSFGICTIMLTGGRGAMLVYQELSALLYQLKEPLHFFFGDERCVPPDHEECNYRLAMQSLFLQGVPPNFIIHRIQGEADNKQLEAERYAALLPDNLDVVLLSIGEDGHIASIFPGDKAVHETRVGVLPVTASKPPYERITVSPKVIAVAKHVFCLAKGAAKGIALRHLFENINDIVSFPARLVKERQWLLDESADNEIRNITV